VATLNAGIPETVPVVVVNRQCSSGLEAIAEVASCIRSGYIDIGIAAGFESMTISPRELGAINPRIEQYPGAKDCTLDMGVTSEIVAERYSVSREKQDQFALESQQKVQGLKDVVGSSVAHTMCGLQRKH
jgi:acetyl-CoA acyltransferase 1